MYVGHTDGDCAEIFRHSLEVGVAARLRKMHRHRSVKTVHIAEQALDLVDGVTMLGIVENSVGAALHGDGKCRSVVSQHLLVLETDLGAVARGLSLLDASVDPRTLRHGICVPSRGAVVNVTAARQKLHKITYGDRYAHGLRRLPGTGEISRSPFFGRGTCSVYLGYGFRCFRYYLYSFHRCFRHFIHGFNRCIGH